MSLFNSFNKGGGLAGTPSRPTITTPAPPRPSYIGDDMGTTQNRSAATPLPSSYRLGKVRADVKAARTKVDAMIGKRDLLLAQREKAEKDKAEAERQLATFDLVQILLQKTSEYAREQVKARVEEIVSQALNVVYGENHRFIIQLGVRAGQPVADYYLDDGQVITKLEKPYYGRGGGKIDVISLALKLAVGELEGVTGPLFMDEVGKHVSEEYRANVAYFLKQYSAQFNRQIILITHSAELAEIGDVGLKVTKNDRSESVVKGVSAV